MAVKAAEQGQVYSVLLQLNSTYAHLGIDECDLLKEKLAFRLQTQKGDVQNLRHPN